jgi:FkbM family methyltransferase
VRTDRKVALAKVLRRLDHPQTRPVLGILASAALTVRNREWCWVRPGTQRREHRIGGRYSASPSLLLRGPKEWEAAFAEQWIGAYQPRAGDTVVDVGAGVGTEVYPLSKLVGDRGSVVAIEAVPSVADCLRWMVRRNRLQNVVVHAVAVSDRPGIIDISTDLDAYEHNSVVANDLYLDAVQTTAVEAETLDRLLGTTPRVDWLKMNIEGAERQALVGASEVLSRTNHVVISCHDFVADVGGPEDLRTTPFVTEVLERHGFKLTRRTDDRPWVRDQIWGDRS